MKPQGQLLLQAVIWLSDQCRRRCDRETSHRGMCNKKAKVPGTAAWPATPVYEIQRLAPGRHTFNSSRGGHFTAGSTGPAEPVIRRLPMSSAPLKQPVNHAAASFDHPPSHRQRLPHYSRTPGVDQWLLALALTQPLPTCTTWSCRGRGRAAVKRRGGAVWGCGRHATWGQWPG